jgi:hypothetical protein
MQSRFKVFWCGVLIEDAIALGVCVSTLLGCVATSSANAATIEAPVLDGLNLQSEWETMQTIPSAEMDKDQPDSLLIPDSSLEGSEQRLVQAPQIPPSIQLPPQPDPNRDRFPQPVPTPEPAAPRVTAACTNANTNPDTHYSARLRQSSS